ncbi:V-type ATP synthase subunit I [Lachnospiraceae bacterium C1.1]|nr:V-type ATP synthase subunit I [Lachnospiraceae bacterium C1.1]
MAVLPMKRVMILGLRKDRKAILESLQRLQTVEFEKDSALPADDPVFSFKDTSDAKALFEKNGALAASALEILNTYSPEKSGLADSFKGRTVINTAEYEKNVAMRDKIMETAKRLNALNKELVDAKAEIPKTEAQMEALSPWTSMDAPLSFKGTKKTRAFIGSFPEALDEATIVGTIESHSPDITGLDVSVISSSDEQTCVMILCLKEDRDAVEEALRRMNFARAPVSDAVPKEELDNLKKHYAETNAQIERLQGQIASYDKERSNLKFLQDYFTMRSDKYDIISKLTVSKRVFIIRGWVPAAEAGRIARLMSNYKDAVVEFTDPLPSDDVPIVLKNNPFSTPVEGVVSDYSLPGPGEIDPTVPVSCFYYILFGMMLSDAAYGLIMVIATGILLSKFKNMETGMRKILRMFFFCGFGTIISGILFGSYFGDMIPVVTKTFFGNEITPWCWIDPLKDPLKMLLVSFTIGIVHLYVGLAILFYTDIKNGKPLDALYDVVFWYMLVTGLIVVGLHEKIVYGIVGLTAPLGNDTSVLIGTVVALVGAVGIILTGGRESKNPFKRLMKGAYALYNVTGYLSDLLSYSRLLALGLATTVISQVFNKLGSMAGGGIAGAILFIIVALVGHSINFGINALGAYVHSNRLTFVEFFGKFYNGGGRAFLPFSMNTKYFKVKEDY